MSPSTSNNFPVFKLRLLVGCWICLSGCLGHPAHPGPETHANGPMAQLIHFYQGPLDHLSAVRYGGCPMAPNCSTYALSAMEQNGLLLGLVMAFDRLIRCGGDELRLSPKVLSDGKWRTYDPVEANQWDSGGRHMEADDWKIRLNSEKQVK